MWADLVPSFGPAERHALLLSTLAGASTTVGAAVAVIRRPGPADLAFLLGLAAGVMAVLAVGEMWLHSALSHGFVPITAAFAGGAALYLALAPLLPEPDAGHWGVAAGAGDVAGARAVAAARSRRGGREGAVAATAARRASLRSAAKPADAAAAAAATALSPAALLRLGLVTAVTMTLHNLPEGFAVAFSSLSPSNLGPLMAAAIAAHNVPEGIVVAAPVYAATGSRAAALALASLSGLSEPLGAAVALTVARPWTGGGEASLAPVLAFAGGVMAAVCAADLLPNGARCGAPHRLAAGVGVGAGVMGWTLWVGV